MNKPTPVYIGIDVAKAKLQVCTPHFNKEIPNTHKEIAACLAKIKGQTGPDACPHVCCEATAAYTNTLRDACDKAGLDLSILNPARIRKYAQAMGELAKTDPIDAAIIRDYAQAKKPLPTPPPTPAERDLRALITQRDALVKCTVQIVGTLEQLPGVKAPCLHAAHRQLDAQIKRLDAQILARAAQDEALWGLASELDAIKGVALASAIRIIVLTPELGFLGRAGCAKLAGLAPFTRESGKWKGQSKIGGGRAEVRRTLYLCCLSGIQHNPPLREVYQRLRQRGKTGKMAMVAAMRKLFSHMNHLARQWRARQAAADGASDISAQTDA